jgi:prolyl-tRNA editing enzyme YbaK/EbsC (Cys-tRNA(Pro) deacylase)
LNSIARKTLEARKVSFAPLEKVLEKNEMEYGGISPLGLPTNYSILIDTHIAEMERLIVGGGYRKSKLPVPGKVLTELANAIIVEGLGVEVSK